MNPDTNKFEQLSAAETEHLKKMFDGSTRVDVAAPDAHVGLLRPDGSPVPEHWSIFTVGELVTVKNYTFKIGYIGESTLLLEAHGPVLVGAEKGG